MGMAGYVMVKSIREIFAPKFGKIHPRMDNISVPVLFPLQHYLFRVKSSF